MIKMFYDRAGEERYIMFRPLKIKNRAIEGTFYIERDFKKIFPNCDPFYFGLNISEFRNLDLKQFKAAMVK